MWSLFFTLSVASLFVFVLLAFAANALFNKSRKINTLNLLLVGVFLSSFFMFMPIHIADTELGNAAPVMLSLFRSMQIFALGADFSMVEDSMIFCPVSLQAGYIVFAAMLYLLAPILTFSFVLSLFKNASSYVRYWGMYFKPMYIFSELNERSLALAEDIRKNHPGAGLAFHDIRQEGEENSEELIGKAGQLGAICFKKSVSEVAYQYHSSKNISFFTIGADESRNLDQALSLIEQYHNRKDTHVYVFSTGIESELLLSDVSKGEVKVRRINEVRSLINRVLYERGEIIFESAVLSDDGIRDISAVIVGMGDHGREMIKALSWFGQMDGYRIGITAFDKDPLAEEKFRAMVPELMSDAYNGVLVEGEAQYTISIHSGCDIDTAAFADALGRLKKATYVFVSLGDDDKNIRASVYLRMLFERRGIHPVIQAVVSDSRRKKALTGVKNFKGQEYDLAFVGDREALYAENVIVNSELEKEALQRHLKWGKEEEFWAYEYNYRSSMASAIHRNARIKCQIPGAEKAGADLSEEERGRIEVLEHKRWNAYMRSEGYIYSGSPDKSSRNDLARVHNDLVDFASLTEEEKRKDSSVGSS